MKRTIATDILTLSALALCLLVMAPHAHAQRQALSLSGEGIVGADDAPDLDISGNAITVEVWIKHDGRSNEDAIIVNKGTTGNGYRLSFVGSGEEPGVRFGADDVDHDSDAIFSNSGIPAGRWTHLAATYDGAQFALYIDGELDNAHDDDNVDVGTNDDPLRIGSDNVGTDRFYSGEIDDIRLWSVSRNQFEMAPSPFNPPAGDEAGLVAHYTFDDVSGWPVPDLAGANDELTRTGSAPLVTPGVYPITPNLFAVSENAQVDLQWNEWRGPNGENDAAEFKVYRSTQADGSDRTELATVDGATASYTDTGADNGTLYYYEVTAIGAEGESDYSQMVTARPYATRGGGSLTIEHGSYASMSDRPSLDGYDRQVVNFEQTISLEVWIKHDGQSDEDAVILNKGTTTDGYRLSFVGSGEEPGVRFGADDVDTHSDAIISNSGIPAGQWTHLAATYDGAQLVLYINGELDNGRDDDNIDVGANDNPLRIGADNGGTARYFSGQLDELRLWNVARTRDQIADHYRQELTGAVLDPHLRLDRDRAEDEEGLITYFRFDDIGSTNPQSADAKHLTMELLGAASIAGLGVFPLPPYGYADGEDGSTELSWHDRTAGGASQVKVYRSTQPDGSDRTQLASFAGTTTSYTDTGVDNETLYYYEITAVDAEGQESDFSYVDPALASASRGGTTLVLDGENDYATVTTRPSLNGYDRQLVNFEQTITIEVWVMHDGQSVEDAIIVNKGTTTDGYRLSFDGSGEEPGVRFGADDVDTHSDAIISNSGIPAGQWTHLAATYDGAQLALYIDGELDHARDDDNIDVGANDNPLVIGAANGGIGRYFSGQLDELRLWNVERTQDEIAANHRQELVGDEEDLIAYFRFDEPGSTTAHNSATLAMTAVLFDDAHMGDVSALPADEADGMPGSFALEGNYPNPFSGSSTVRYALPEPAQVRVAVYDMLGRQVATLVDAMRPAGTHDVTFGAEGLSSGIYIARFEAGNIVMTERMTIVR